MVIYSSFKDRQLEPTKYVAVVDQNKYEYKIPQTTPHEDFLDQNSATANIVMAATLLIARPVVNGALPRCSFIRSTGALACTLVKTKASRSCIATFPTLPLEIDVIRTARTASRSSIVGSSAKKMPFTPHLRMTSGGSGIPFVFPCREIRFNNLPFPSKLPSTPLQQS